MNKHRASALLAKFKASGESHSIGSYTCGNGTIVNNDQMFIFSYWWHDDGVHHVFVTFHWETEFKQILQGDEKMIDVALKNYKILPA